ncbi:MAG TPA: siderophore-interacting protein [Flavobacterium sp.]|nr:siderophore-interacting protein [Flavobacterium sp.]
MSKPNKAAARKVFNLKSKEYLTPHYIRITLSGDVSVFRNTTIGDNNKIFIPPKGVSKVYLPELDPENSTWIHPPQEVAPFVRTYTHMGIDVEKGELIIDFVNHSENGPASAWAINSVIGDELGVAMRTEPKELFPKEADWLLLVGDLTALPVISSILKKLPKTVKGVCIIEVPTKEDEQVLETNAAVDFIWLYNSHPEIDSELANEVKKVKLGTANKFGFVACEFSSVKEIRSYLRKEIGWTSAELQAYSYWKSGVAEDKSVTDRQTEKNSIA